MTTAEVDAESSPDGPQPDPPRRSWLWWVRLALMLCWGAGLIAEVSISGIPTNQLLILLWPLSGAAIWSIGKRRPWEVALDFLPLIAILVAWSYLRGFADSLGMPTWWHPQLDDREVAVLRQRPDAVAAGAPQGRRRPQWWEVPVAFTYLSFFIVPGVTAAILWLRKRRDFYRWSTRYVVLSFASYLVFALAPTAPPWAAARCTARRGRRPSERPAVHGHRPFARDRRPARPGCASATGCAALGAADFGTRVERDPFERRQDLGEQRPRPVRPGRVAAVTARRDDAALRDLHVAAGAARHPPAARPVSADDGLHARLRRRSLRDRCARRMGLRHRPSRCGAARVERRWFTPAEPVAAEGP